MKKMIRSRRILINHTLVMLAFFAAMVVANLTFLHSSHHSLRKLDEHHNQKLFHLLKLAELSRERSVAMLTMYMTDDPWLRDEQFLIFQRMALEFIEHRQQLEQLPFTAMEQQFYQKALAIVRHTEPLQKEIVERIHSGKVQGLRQEIANIELPTEHRLHELFEQLTRIAHNNAAETREQARQQYSKNLYLGIIASTLLLVAVFLLMRRSLYSIGDIEVELLQQTAELSWEASHDPLTQLLNRRGLVHHIELLSNCHKPDQQHTLLYLDLDDFKPVNDQFGHEFGDKMLIGLSQEFHSCIRKGDALARIGGDEFAVVLEGCDTDTAVRIAQCMLDKAQGHVIQNDKIAIKISGCSIGLLPFIVGEQDIDSLLSLADSACYDSKRAGKNRINIHAEVA